MTKSPANASPQRQRPAIAHRLVQVSFVAALALLAYLALGLAGGWSATIDALQRLGPGQWSLLIGLSLLNYGLRFFRWHHYLLSLGARLPVGHDLLIYVAGFAFTVTPGKAGEAMRSVYLRAFGIPWSPGLAALTAERILDLAAVGLLAGLALAGFADYILPALGLVAAVAAGLFAITHPRVVDHLLGLLPASGRWGQLRETARQTLDHARSLLSPRRMAFGLAIGLIAWGAEALGLYLLLDWLGADTDLLPAIGIYAASMLAGAASFLPGGLGGAEAAMVALLLASGIALTTATTATLVCRAVTLWFAVLLGIGAVLRLSYVKPDAHTQHHSL